MHIVPHRVYHLLENRGLFNRDDDEVTSNVYENFIYILDLKILCRREAMDV